MKMTRTLAATLGAFTFFLATALAEPASLSVKEIWPVQLQEPALFWVNGKEVPVKELVMARVGVSDVSDFFPHAMATPVFVVGDAVGRTLRSPILDREAIVVWPRSVFVSGARLILWPGERPETVTRERVEAILKTKDGKKQSISIRLTKKRAEETAPSFNDLRARWTQPRKPHE